MSPETKKMLHHLLTQAARLLGIDNGSLRTDFEHGEAKRIEKTDVTRLEEPAKT